VWYNVVSRKPGAVHWTKETRFTAANGVVTDNLTGLIWLMNSNCAGTTTAPAGLGTWVTAFAWVAELNSGGTMNSQPCGDTSGASNSRQTDWRLPNVREMQSLIDYGNFSPALPTGHPFTNVQSSYYWTSSTNVYYPASAWDVNLSYGIVNDNVKSSYNCVWPVRGGQ